MMEEKKVKMEEEPEQTYLEMAENLKLQDVSKVLQLMLKIRKSVEIKNSEIKNAASKLIRAIEIS